MKTALLSLAGGLFVAIIASALMNLLNRFLYPLPPEVMGPDIAALEAYLAAMPTGAFVISVAGMLLCGGSGGLTAALIDRAHGYRNGALVGAFFTMVAASGMVMVKHPLQLWIAAVLSYIPAALIGARAALILDKEKNV